MLKCLHTMALVHIMLIRKGPTVYKKGELTEITIPRAMPLEAFAYRIVVSVSSLVIIFFSLIKF